MYLKMLLFCTSPHNCHQLLLFVYHYTSDHQISPCLSPSESSWRPGRQRCGGCGRSAWRSGGQWDGINPPAADVAPAAGYAQQPLLPAERDRLLGPARRLHQDQTTGRRAGPQRGIWKVYITLKSFKQTTDQQSLQSFESTDSFERLWLKWCFSCNLQLKDFMVYKL